MTTHREALAFIRRASDRFSQVCESTPNDVRSFKSTPETWCVADVAEHVTISHRNLMTALGQLKERAAEASPSDVIDEEIPYLFYRAGEPPGLGAPTGSFAERRSNFAAYAPSVDTILKWGDGVGADLRAIGATHPMFGRMDGVQWLIFGGAHIERHRAQILGSRVAHAANGRQ